MHHTVWAHCYIFFLYFAKNSQLFKVKIVEQAGKSWPNASGYLHTAYSHDEGKDLNKQHKNNNKNNRYSMLE